MLTKIKSYAATIAAVVIAVLSALLFNRNRKVQSLESDLAKEKANDAIKQNEQDRQAAKQNADALVEVYDRLKRDQ